MLDYKTTLRKLALRDDRYIEALFPPRRAGADESGLDVSSATIRNELADLESQGYLLQPHTSAGRAPSELGYRYYVAHFLERKKPGAATAEAFADAVGRRVEERAEDARLASGAGERAVEDVEDRADDEHGAAQVVEQDLVDVLEVHEHAAGHAQRHPCGGEGVRRHPRPGEAGDRPAHA